MHKTFVRVYHMRDGSSYTAGAYYLNEEQAVADLRIFSPVETGGGGYEPDFSEVEYATVEARYTPVPAIDSNWKVSQYV